MGRGANKGIERIEREEKEIKGKSAEKKKRWVTIGDSRIIEN